MNNIKNIMMVLIPFVLCGCSSVPDEKVVNFVTETKKEKTGRLVDKMPAIIKVEPVKFSASDIRDPFRKGEDLLASKNRPDANRPREVLEGFALKSLEMVGTLEREDMFFALLRDPGGIVHIAGVGNYVGENSGKIEKINDTEVQIQEWLPDGRGGFRQHKAVIRFSVAKTTGTGPGTGGKTPIEDPGVGLTQDPGSGAAGMGPGGGMPDAGGGGAPPSMEGGGASMSGPGGGGP